MKDHIRYKGYDGSVHYNDKDEIFYGKVEGIKSLISYEGCDAKSLKAAFQESIDDYLRLCQEKAIEPEIPFKGSFNIRIGNRLHRKAVEYAWSRNTSLNTIAKEAFTEFFESHQV